MSKKDIRFWFLASTGDTGVVDYLVSAVSMEQAKKRFGPLAQTYDFKLLTWSELTVLTDCDMPSTFKGSDYACGELYFLGDKKPFVITVA